jgi:hypothetical protein
MDTSDVWSPSDATLNRSCALWISSSFANRSFGSHANNILANRPWNVDWSKRCPVSEYGIHDDAVDDSTTAAAPDTTATPAAAANRLAPIGTASEDDDEADDADDSAAVAPTVILSSGAVDLGRVLNTI